MSVLCSLLFGCATDDHLSEKNRASAEAFASEFMRAITRADIRREMQLWKPILPAQGVWRGFNNDMVADAILNEVTATVYSRTLYNGSLPIWIEAHSSWEFYCRAWMDKSDKSIRVEVSRSSGPGRPHTFVYLERDGETWQVVQFRTRYWAGESRTFTGPGVRDHPFSAILGRKITIPLSDTLNVYVRWVGPGKGGNGLPIELETDWIRGPIPEGGLL